MKISKMVKNLATFLVCGMIFYAILVVGTIYTNNLNNKYFQVNMDTKLLPKIIQNTISTFENEAVAYAQGGNKENLDNAKALVETRLPAILAAIDNYQYKEYLGEQYLADIGSTVEALQTIVAADYELISGPNGHSESAVDYLTNEDHINKLDALEEQLETISTTASDEYSQRSKRMVKINEYILYAMVTSVSGFSILIYIVLTIVGRRVKKLSEVIENVEHLADGKFEYIKEVEFKVEDEAFEINRAVEGAISNIKGLSDDLVVLANEHRDGNVSYFINADNYSGEYAHLITQVNDVVKEYVDMIRDSLGCMEEISKGNFDVELKLDVYRGDKAGIKDIVTNTVSNLKRLEGEINFVINRV